MGHLDECPEILEQSPHNSHYHTQCNSNAWKQILEVRTYMLRCFFFAISKKRKRKNFYAYKYYYQHKCQVLGRKLRSHFILFLISVVLIVPYFSLIKNNLKQFHIKNTHKLFQVLGKKTSFLCFWLFHISLAVIDFS